MMYFLCLVTGVCIGFIYGMLSTEYKYQIKNNHQLNGIDDDLLNNDISDIMDDQCQNN